MKIARQTNKSKMLEMNSSELEIYQNKVLEEKADFNTLLDTLSADPKFALQETQDIIEAYFKKWKPKELPSLGIPES